MNKHKVKIPKGTIIDIDGKSLLLKKPIFAHSDGEKIVLTDDQITTDILTVERRHMESSTPATIPRIKTENSKVMNMETLNTNGVPRTLHKTAFGIVENQVGPKTLQTAAAKYLKLLIDTAVKEIEPKKEIKEKPKVTKPKGPIPPASDD